jgi:hypothetical protein
MGLRCGEYYYGSLWLKIGIAPKKFSENIRYVIEKKT